LQDAAGREKVGGLKRYQTGKIKWEQVIAITVEIPEELAGYLIGAGKDPAREVLEAIALEGYRSDRLSEAEVRRLLGFETRMEVDAFLKEHGVFLHYTYDDFLHDREIASEAADRLLMERQRNPPGQRRAG